MSTTFCKRNCNLNINFVTICRQNSATPIMCTKNHISLLEISTEIQYLNIQVHHVDAFGGSVATKLGKLVAETLSQFLTSFCYIVSGLELHHVFNWNTVVLFIRFLKEHGIYNCLYRITAPKHLRKACAILTSNIS